MDIFVFDNTTSKLKINQHEILLTKEFKELWDPSRNKCKKDPTGIERLKAYKEFTYIYLMCDWKSQYHKYLEKDRHEAAMLDSELTEKEFNDEVFQAALKKYDEIQNADRILSLIKVAYRKLYQTEVFLDNIDYTEVDNNGKPIYKPSDVFKDIGSLSKIRIELEELERSYKAGLGAANKVRGDNDPGFGDMG